MMFKYAFVASVGIASAFAAATPAVDLKSVLQQPKNNWSPTTQIFFPTDPDYANETTQRWNFYSAPSYLASIKPGTEADVQKVVSWPTPSIRSKRLLADVLWGSYRSNWLPPINFLSLRPVVDMATARHLVSFKTALSSI